MKSASPPASGRLEYLDFIRGFFILVMIEGHTLRLFLSPEIKATLLYQYQDLIHNLTGPVFLFAAGAAYVYSTSPRWDAVRRWNPRLRSRLSKWLVVLVIGYALQLTFGSLRRTLTESTPEDIAYLFGLNVLHCIVFSLLLLQLLALLIGNREWFFRACVLAALGIAMTTAFAWEYGQSTPVWIASLLSIHTRSVFPLFPYAGFAFAGAAWGHLHLRARDAGRESALLRRCAVFALALGIPSLAAGRLPLPQVYAHFWSASPLSFLFRVAILMLLAAGARWVEPILLPRLRGLAVIGRQSLLIFAVHLPILYGSAFNPDTSLRKALGVPLPLTESILVCLGLTVLMITVALWWDRWRREHASRARGVWWLIAAYYSVRFLLT